VADAGAVIVAGSAIRSDELLDLYRMLQALDVEVRVSAGLPELAASRVTVQPLDGLAVLSLRHNQLDGLQAAIKRGFDLAAASLLFVLVAPVLGAIAALVRLTSGPGVIFRQVRVGEGGRPFVIYKFRTMVRDAEIRLDELRDRNQADGLLFKIDSDPRVTRAGRFLRRSGLDELPQLWNVIRGDMSLVGPRPPLPEEATRYDEWVRGRLRVKPGITGLWQVNGRHELSFADYVRYDLFYVENWSLALDLYVIARTPLALLSRRGSF
jgi:exopolysaccharide biosynthesis polyprenyl glycosylphosphotransferase